MNREMFKSGIRASLPDIRDFNLAMACRAIGEPIQEALPYEYNHTYPDLVLNQGDLPMCVGYGMSAAKCIMEYEQTGKVIRFSPGYIYADRFGFYTGEGMITRDALIAVQKWGAVEYDDFPYVGSYDELYPLLWGTRGEKRDALRIKAFPYRISSFYRLDVDGEDLAYNIKKALVNGMLVATVFDVYDSFFDVGSDGIVPIPKPGEKNYGGHFTLTPGYRGDLTNTLNSWGEKWGDKGYAHFPLDYPFREVWAMSDKIDANLVKLQQKFEDADLFSSWGRETCVQGIELGLMQGDGKVFNPQSTPTREQMLIALTNLYNKLK